MSVMQLCLCSSRSPWRRKKNCLLVTIPVIAIIAFMQMIEVDEVYSPLHPLSDAKSEARRLLKIMTHYNYQCNLTSQIGNTSVWPICIDKAINLNMDDKHRKLLYTLGSGSDYTMERNLAVNYSFVSYLVSPLDISAQIHGVNNTFSVRTAIVANDPADFSRNSYGQRTLNDLLAAQRHSHVDLLRILSTSKNVETWHLLHFLIKDGLMSNVNQLHLVVYIEKVDDEYLYNWYRTLYELFARSNMYLYHTSSHDPLCLQVTLMESCVYFLSFVHNPGPTVFVLYPPADFGTEEQEDLRLLDYLNTPQVGCKRHMIGKAENKEQVSSPVKFRPQWQICSRGSEDGILRQPCIVARFRMKRELTLEEEFIRNRCAVYTFAFSSVKGTRDGNLHLYVRSDLNSEKTYKPMSIEAVFHFLSNLGYISLIEIDEPGKDWFILGELLSSGILQNVTQLVAGIQVEDKTSGIHPHVTRSQYSQLKRLESYGLALVHSSHDWPCKIQQNDSREMPVGVNCYKITYARLKDL